MKLDLLQINRPSSIISRPSSFVWSLVTIMNLQSLKNRVNIEKNRQIKGKITKNSKLITNTTSLLDLEFIRYILHGLFSIILILSSIYCLLYSFVKNQLNNEKNKQIKGKITKSSITFSENKPNLKNIEINVSSFQTGKYEILTAWRSKKQTQFKANSNPILERPKMNANPFNKMIYKNFMLPAGLKTKPKQTQNKANFFKSISSLNFYDCFIRLFFGPDFDKMENWLCER